MAYAGYGAKYTLTFSDVYQTTPAQYIATIYKKGYSSTVFEINGTGDPVTIQTDRDGESSYRPIISTLATVNVSIQAPENSQPWETINTKWEDYNVLWNATSTALELFDFIGSEPDTMLLEIKLKQPGGSYAIKWQGYYINTTDFSLSEIYPINVSLQFSDFSLLKSKRFYDFVTADTDKNVKFKTNDKASLLEIFLKACNFGQTTQSVYLDFNNDLTNLYKTPSSTISIPLTADAVYLQKNAFLAEIGRYETMYDAISAICKQYLLVCYYKDNVFYVTSYFNLINGLTRTYLSYQVNSVNLFNDTVSYTQLSNVVETDTVSAVNSPDFRNLDRSQIVYFSSPKKNFVYENNSSANVNINNYNFNTPAFRSYTSVTGPGGTTTTTYTYAIARWYDKNLEEYEYTFEEQGPPFTTLSFPLIKPFYPYSITDVATPTQFDYATRFSVLAGLDFDKLIQSTPLAVNPSDYVSISFSYRTDGRLKSAPSVPLYEPKTKLALVLKATDKNGVEANFFYDKTTGKFKYIGAYITSGTPSFNNYLLDPVVTTNFKGDSDRGVFNLSGRLDIPSGGELRVIMYLPYNDDVFVNNDDEYAMYVEYLNMQTFKGNDDKTIPKTQKYTISYEDVVAVDDNIENKIDVFNLDGTQYNLATLPQSDSPNRITPFLVSSYIGNHLVDTYNNPAAGIDYNYTEINYNNISYTNLKTSLTTKGRYVLSNNGLLATRVQGVFKSDPNFTIGKKFSYSILNQPSNSYAMLDYSISLKNASYDAILYSINYTSDAGKTVLTNTILK
jgi:hypothetical protein